jgi:hypothetical protein
MFLRGFPPIVLDNIISIILNERKDAFLTHNTVHGEFDSTEPEDDRLRMALNEMSLVHPSWTWPVQKALGREIRISDENVLQSLRKVITSVLIGPWTRSLSLKVTRRKSFRFFRARMIPRQDLVSAKAQFDNELSCLLIQLLKKLPNLRYVSLQLMWASESSTTQKQFYDMVFDQLATHSQIHTLVLSITVPADSPVFAEMVESLVGQLPNLTRLGFTTSNCSRSSSSQSPQTWHTSACEEVQRLAKLKALKLDINRGTNLKSVQRMLAGSQIQHLNLNLQGYHEDLITIDAELSLNALFTLLNPSRSFAFLHELRISSIHTNPINEADVITILRYCCSLEVFHLLPRYGGMRYKGILQALPPTLTEFHFTHKLLMETEGDSVSGHTISDFDRTLCSWVCDSLFRLTHPSISVLDFSITYQVTIPSRQWQWSTEGVEALNAMAKPTLYLSQEVCNGAGIVLQTNWVRSVVPAPPPQPGTPQYGLPGQVPPLPLLVPDPVNFANATEQMPAPPPAIPVEQGQAMNQLTTLGLPPVNGENILTPLQGDHTPLASYGTWHMGNDGGVEPLVGDTVPGTTVAGNINPALFTAEHALEVVAEGSNTNS